MEPLPSRLIHAVKSRFKSWRISSETVGNAIISDAILASRGMVQEGVLLSNALIRQKVLPDMALNMLAIGEETGEMDKMLSKVADFYEDEVGAMVRRSPRCSSPR